MSYPSLKSLFQKARVRWPFLLVVLIVLLAIGVWGCIEAIGLAKLAGARQALAKGELDQAHRILMDLIDHWPSGAQGRLLAANTARRMEAFDEAERHLRAYEAKYGATELYLLEKALVRAQSQGPSPEDDRLLREELKPDRARHWPRPNEVEILEALTLGYRRVEQATATLHCANELLEVEPDHVKGLLARGWAQERFTRMSGALDDYQKAAHLDPQNIEARLSLGELLLNFNQPAEAVEHFEWLRTQRPENVGVGFGLARCRMALGELDDAARILDELLERHDTHPLLLEARGHVAVRQNKTDDALRYLQEAVDRAPYLRQANYELSQSLLRQGRAVEAQKYQEQVDRIDADTKRLGELYKVLSSPAHTAAQCHEAAVLSLRLGNKEDGMRWLEAAIHKDPALAEAHALMADVYERHGDKQRAELHRRQAERK
jgi:predicted Zn-dependent protease